MVAFTVAKVAEAVVSVAVELVDHTGSTIITRVASKATSKMRISRKLTLELKKAAR